MLSAILAWMLKSQGAKVAGAATGGSVISVAVLMGMMDHSVDAKIAYEKESIIRLIDNEHNLVFTKMNYMSSDITEIKELVKITNQRVYELNLKTKE